MIKDQQIFECSCGDLAHVFKVYIDDDQELIDYLFFEFVLSEDFSWYKRVWLGLRYMFIGNISLKDFVLSKDQAVKFYNHLKSHVEKRKKNVKSVTGDRKKNSKRKMR